MTYPAELFKKRAPRPADFVAFDPAEIEGSIGSRFEKMVTRYPDRIAYQDDAGLRLTYAEFNSTANRIANYLLERELVQLDDRALLLFASPARTIMTSLALFKCGVTTVFLDDTYPQARLEHIVRDTQASLLLTENAHRALAQALSLPPVRMVAVEDILSDSHEEGNPGLDIPPATYSHILYSSGSTGQPKGIIHAHNTVLHFVCHVTQVYAYSAADRLPSFSSLGHGGTLEDVYAALLNGGAVLPYPLRSRGFAGLPDWMREQQATVVSSSPTTVRGLAQQLEAGEQLPQVRLVSSGGEANRYDDLLLSLRKFPNATIAFNYGTSEALWVTACFVDRSREIEQAFTMPVGYAFGEHEVLILDEDHEPVPEGEIGQFAVRSSYLSPGYWGNEARTRSTYLTDPDDPRQRLYLSGDLGREVTDELYLHLGRKDFQIKVRGFRIEPGETETALLQIDGVREAVVVGRPDQAGDMMLLAYIETEGHTILLADHLRQALAERLPDYLIPARFIVMDSLPRTSSSKVDRYNLPDPGRARPDLSTPYTPPRSEVEYQIASMWASELDLDRIGIHDDFFDLGGHSLLATQLITRLSQTLGLDINYERLFDAPTVAAMTKLAGQMTPQNQATPTPRIEAQPRQAHQVKRRHLDTMTDDE